MRRILRHSHRFGPSPRATLVAALAFATLIGMTGLAKVVRVSTPVEIRPGDHISLIGNTLADRMQHDGWLETLPPQPVPRARAGHPQPRLLRRRADDPAALGQLRHPRPVADRDQDRRRLRLLRLQRVVRAAGGARQVQGRPRRTSSSTRSRRSTTARRAPRLVLFSPIAHEDLHDRNLPDGTENNGRLELYTAAMAEVARAHNVPFVDLFHPTQRALRRRSHSR